MKKFLKIIGFSLLFIIAAIFIIPLVFEDDILEMVKKTANANLNADFEYEDGSLSIWRNFPNTQVTLNNIHLINDATFKGDTLLTAEKVSLNLPLLQLFSGSSKINVTSFEIDGADLKFKTAANGAANYNIFKTVETDETVSKDEEVFQLQLDHYAIRNSHISYSDSKSKMRLELFDLNHSGIGNLSADLTTLDTKSNAKASFTYDSVAYLDRHSLDLKALIGIDIKTNTYSFKENEAYINKLPLAFKGFIQRFENHQEIDLSFKTPSSDFKNFLALIPEVYSKNIEGVSTTGNFDLHGKLFGRIDSTHIPKFNIVIRSDDASFKYPDLPKKLENIQLNTEIGNSTGLTKDSYVHIDTLSFRIDQDVFNAGARLTDLTTNMKVKAALKGDLNLSKLAQVHPADGLKKLKGNLGINANTNFDMLSIERKQYENTKINGLFKLDDFEYESSDLSDKLNIDKSTVLFNDKTVTLKEFVANIGQTDLNASGSIYNMLGFIFNKEDIEGKFALQSDVFNLNDFKSTNTQLDQDTVISSTSKEAIKIPAFLNCSIDAKANTVIYDNITLKKLSGQLVIKDEKAELKNISSEVFDGKLGLNGFVSTKNETPTFSMALDIKKFDIASSFSQLSLFQSLAPIAKSLEGKLNTVLSLSGNLNDEFTPDLNSIQGAAAAELLSATLSENSTVLNKLSNSLQFLDTKKLNLKNLKTALSFKDGKVQIDPFTVTYEDIKMDVSGGHGFDNSLGYKAILDVPAKYLGNEGSKLLAQLSSDEQSSIKIPINARISGSISQPQIKTDFKDAIGDLSKRLLDNQKEKVKEKAGDLLNDLITGRKKENDSIQLDSTKIIKGDKTKEAAKNLLNNLLNRKKKDTVKKN